MNNITFEEVKDILKRSIDETATVNDAIERTVQHIYLKGYNNAKNDISQQKTGHWITTRTFMHDGEYYCDKCKCDSPYNEKWDYCPNCGAKMEVENK